MPHRSPSPRRAGGSPLFRRPVRICEAGKLRRHERTAARAVSAAGGGRLDVRESQPAYAAQSPGIRKRISTIPLAGSLRAAAQGVMLAPDDADDRPAERLRYGGPGTHAHLFRLMVPCYSTRRILRAPQPSECVLV